MARRAVPTTSAPSPKQVHDAGAPRREPVRKTVTNNRRARHDYDILEVVECGIALAGGEVKSLRQGRMNIADAYAKVDRGELWLHGAHIAPYVYATGFGAFDPDRSRKLLLHRHEIDELAGKAAQQSLTLVPLSVYFWNGLAKVELALARGRRLHDKRQAIAKRDAERETAREVTQATRRP